MIVRKVDWVTIKLHWEQGLWRNHKSPIEPVSSRLYMGGYDLDIKNYEPTFFAVYRKVVNGEQLMGVNSGVKTSKRQYRSRGLYVSPDCRGKGVGGMLLHWTIHQAVVEGCTTIWNIPHKRELRSYEKVGFVQTSDWFDEGMEYGPNCYALKSL